MANRTRKADGELLARFKASEKLPAILKGLGLFLKDYSSGACVPNTLWADLGYNADDLRTDRWRELLHPDDRERVLFEWDRVLRGDGDAWHGDYRLRDAAGAWRRLRHRTIVLERDAHGLPSLTVGIDQDLTELMEALEAEKTARLEAEGRLFEAELLRAAGVVTSSALDPAEAAERVLAQARSILPFDAAVVWSRDGQRLRCVGSHGLEVRCAESCKVLAERSVEERRPLLVRGSEARASGGFPALSRLCVPLLLRDRAVGALDFLSLDEYAFAEEGLRRAVSFGDHAAIALANAFRFGAAEREAMTDWLTGLGTRRRFEERGRALLADERAMHGAACLMIDIDHFKAVNDAWGHPAGDAVLKALGAICRKAVREGDLVCRYGGEEISVLMPGASAKAALEAAERVRCAAEHATISSRPGLSFSVSIGAFADVVDRSSPGTELDRLLASADLGLYRAKEGGRNRVELEHPPESAVATPA